MDPRRERNRTARERGASRLPGRLSVRAARAPIEACVTTFGEALFSRSPFLFWALAPFLCLGLWAVGSPLEPWREADVLGTVVTLACDAAAMLLLLALWPHHRMPGVRRGLTGVVALAYGAYAFVTWNPGLLPAGAEPGDPFRALIGLVVIGVPCFWYTLTGTWRGPGAHPARTD